MSVNDLPSGASGTVGAQAEGVQREAKALSAAMKRARNTRWLLSLLVLACLAVFVWKFYGLGKRVIDPMTDIDHYRAELQQVAMNHVKKNENKYRGEADKLYKSLLPKLQAIVEK